MSYEALVTSIIALSSLNYWALKRSEAVYAPVPLLYNYPSGIIAPGVVPMLSVVW